MEMVHLHGDYTINRVLCTKDGRVIGNAIIIEIVKPDLTMHCYRFKIKTDYGNEALLTDAEIDRLFYHCPRKASKDHKYYVHREYKRKGKTI